MKLINNSWRKTQKKSSAWRRLYMRYRFWLICINYNFAFLVLYKMYSQNYFARRSIILESFTSHLQHSRPCCIRYTNSRLRLEFVYLIQHGRSCCKYYLYLINKLTDNIYHSKKTREIWGNIEKILPCSFLCHAYPTWTSISEIADTSKL